LLIPSFQVAAQQPVAAVRPVSISLFVFLKSKMLNFTRFAGWFVEPLWDTGSIPGSIRHGHLLHAGQAGPGIGGSNIFIVFFFKFNLI
jgi:hypothetical protein